MKASANAIKQQKQNGKIHATRKCQRKAKISKISQKSYAWQQNATTHKS